MGTEITLQQLAMRQSSRCLIFFRYLLTRYTKFKNFMESSWTLIVFWSPDVAYSDLRNHSLPPWILRPVTLKICLQNYSFCVTRELVRSAIHRPRPEPTESIILELRPRNPCFSLTSVSHIHEMYILIYWEAPSSLKECHLPRMENKSRVRLLGVF